MSLVSVGEDGRRRELNCPVSLPRASAFLFNGSMMIQLNCRGYATAQHMQPEPAKYSHGPNVEARTFMQPEQPFYAHHPGRFFYIKDEDSGELFSAPHEPVRRKADQFVFSVGQSDVTWRIKCLDVEVEISVSLPAEDAVELWTFRIKNPGTSKRRLSIYPSFTIGYMSWMNQSANYNADLGGIIASSVTPYQKIEDFPAILNYRDKTFLLHDTPATAYECGRESFEGEGGIQHPDGVTAAELGNGAAIYETPIATLQHRYELDPGEGHTLRFLFGPARDEEEIANLKQRYLGKAQFVRAHEEYKVYLAQAQSCLEIDTPDNELDQFVNHWLPRQMFYHGDSNRLTTDPQTRNFLQDSMGMSYVAPSVARDNFIRVLQQQKPDGSLPEGIRLTPEAELKYINQVPHTDHCVWLPVCVQGYLDESGDYDLLTESIIDEDGKEATVFERVTDALRSLLRLRTSQNLILIAQGDWCDPMNMVGHRGKGVSGWLSIATVYALKQWAGIASRHGANEVQSEMKSAADEMIAAIQGSLWDGNWYARGITDDGNTFGVASDPEGKIFLNPQSWAFMAGIPNTDQVERMLKAIGQHLETPWGAQMLAPAYRNARADIGRVTQKHPGSAENGSIYNHASAFYIFSLYEIGAHDHAWNELKKMLPGSADDDLLLRGQLPVFIPNYYRGAWREFPDRAGRSSHLFNTGTISWFYRILVQGLFGLTGCAEGLMINPKLPTHWSHARVQRHFRGATFNFRFERVAGMDAINVTVDGKAIEGALITAFNPGESYSVEVQLPEIME